MVGIFMNQALQILWFSKLQYIKNLSCCFNPIILIDISVSFLFKLSIYFYHILL